MAVKLKAEIALINDNRNLLESHSSLIQQNSDNILLRVTSQEVDDTLTSVLSSYAQLSVLSDEIDLLVAKTSYTGTEIASRINLGTGGILLKAERIKFEGLVTANNYFKILTDGSIEATNGKFSGILETYYDGVKRIEIDQFGIDFFNYLGNYVGQISGGQKGIYLESSFDSKTSSVKLDNDFFVVDISTGGKIEVGYNAMGLFVANKYGFNITDTAMYIMLNGTLRTITRDSNGFLKAT